MSKVEREYIGKRLDKIKTSIKNSINKISKESYINYFKSSLEKNKKDIELSKSRYVRKPKIYKN